jgi:hypothetical protein
MLYRQAWGVVRLLVCAALLSTACDVVKSASPIAPSADGTC